MASYNEIMQSLRESTPQGSDDPKSARKTLLDIKGVTSQGGKKNMPYTPGEEGSDTYQLLKRVESREAFPESDSVTGVTEKPGDLGEIAYPQTDPMYAEEALINKMAKATEPKQDDPKPQVASPTLKKALKQGKSKPSKVTPPEPTQDEDTGDFSDDTGEPTFKPITVNNQGVEINEAVVKHHGEDFLIEDTPGKTDIFDILDQYEKDLRGPDMSDEDRQTAAGIDFDKAEEEGQEIWSGDGPGEKGELAFFENPDGGDPLGFFIYPDGSVQVVTGMLFPPTQ